MVHLFHYASAEKVRNAREVGFMQPSSPFNPHHSGDWKGYSERFNFPVAEYNTCCFLEPEPASWKRYGLFDLLMEEFSTGDVLLRIDVSDRRENPLLIRDHHFHSPGAYNMTPERWKDRKHRDSIPYLRQRWLESTVPLRKYSGNFICPEILVPFPISADRIFQVGASKA